jgi:predicted Zn finger-like uncharacterized protein
LIIACPECTSPFQVVDGQIAALVQVECPTCRFRMILDFAAANDAALREDGMQYAQGFLDEATYRQAVGGESYSTVSSQAVGPELHAVPEPEPELEPEPEPEPVAQVAEPVRRSSFTPAPDPQPVQPVAPVQPQAEPARAKPPVRARPTLIAHTAPPPVRQPAELIPQTGHATPAVEPRAEAEIDTHVGRAPMTEVAAPVEVSRPADNAQLEVPADEFSVDLDEPEPETRTPQPRPRPVEQAEPRTPPHSPAPPSTTRPTPDEPEVPAIEPGVPAIEPKPPEQDEQTGTKGSGLRTALLMLMLLILMGAAGLMGWSVIETQDPNPLPMLKDKFGIDLGFGIPAEPDAPQPGADGAQADKAGADKAGADKAQ